MASVDLIKNVLASTFEIDGISITLTQRKSDNPVIFNGSGKITQDNDGNLLLHMIHVNPEGIPFAQLGVNPKDCLPGTIIPDEHYYDMDFLDTHGFKWTAKMLELNNHYFFPTNSVVIKSRFNCLTKRQQRLGKEKSTRFQFIIPYSIDLPYNQFEYDNGQSRRIVLSAKISGMDIKINNSEGKLIVSASVPEPITLDLEQYVQAVLRGLSIAVGMQLNLVLEETWGGDIQSIKIRSLHKISKSHLLRPFESKSPDNYPNLINFLDKYVSAFLQAPAKMEELYGYWHKVFVAHDKRVELWALALTTSIEGVFKNNFSDLLKNDDSFEEKLIDTRTKLTVAGIDQEIFEKLCSSLSNFKEKSIAAGLRIHVADKPLFANWPSDWNKLRNKSAHADIIDESPENVQKYWNQAFTCLAIFYHLIAKVIKYDGSLTAYSVLGWPELSKDQEKEEIKTT